MKNFSLLKRASWATKISVLLGILAMPFLLGAGEDITLKNVKTAPALSQFLGQEFVVPIVRAPHRYYLLSPQADAEVRVYQDEIPQLHKLSKGNMFELAITTQSQQAERIIATAPIAVYYADASRFIAIPPAAMDIWGVHQNSVIGALRDNTQLQINSSNGEMLSVQLNAGEKTTPLLSGNTSQDQGSALAIHADQPVGAMTQSSAEDKDVLAFWSAAQLAQNYQLPVAASYLAIVCPQLNTRIKIATAEPIEQTCGDGNSPGKNYITTAQNDLSKGTQINADKPIYVIYQTQAEQARRQLQPDVQTVSATSLPELQPNSVARVANTQVQAAAAITYVNAANPTSGVLSQNTQWRANTTYTLSADVTIPVGVSAIIRSGATLDATAANLIVQGDLIIEAGALLKFGSGTGLSIPSGKLTVQGSAATPVKFTTSSATPVQGSWNGIAASGTAQLNINNALIEYAAYGFQYSGNPTGTITNSQFLNNYFAVSSSSSITENLVFTGNRFEGNEYTVYFYGNGGKPTFNQNSFINNTYQNVYAYNYAVAAPYPLLNFRNNWWGTTDINQIKAKIYDQSDSSASNTYIDYRGFLLSEGGLASDATTQLFGEISANTTLSANKTYQALGSVIIPAGVKLTVYGKIQSYSGWNIKGTLLLNSTASVENLGGDIFTIEGLLDIRSGVRWSSALYGGINIINSGRLNVAGTLASPVIFTASSATPGQGSWGSITVSGTSQANITRAIIEYASTGLQLLDNSVSTTSDSIFRNNSYGLQYGGNPTGTITNSQFLNNYFAVSSNSSTTENLVFTGNRFEGNEYTVYFYGNGGKPTFNQNSFVNNTYQNVYAYNYDMAAPYPLLNFRNNWWGTTDINTIENSIYDQSDNASFGSYIDYRGFLLGEGGVASDATTQLLGEISANTTLAANKTYQVLGSIRVTAGITLTVNGKIQSYDNVYIDGTLLLKNTASIENLSGDAWYIDGLLDIREGVRWSSINGGGININNAGRLNVVGTTAKPVIFTTSSTTPTQSSWSGLVANGTAQLNINYAIIEYAAYGLQYSGNPTGTITNSKFLNNNSGVFSSNSTTENLVFTFNRFESNYYGVNFYGNGGKPTFNQNSFLNNTGLNVYAYNYAVVAPYPLLNFRNNWWGTTDINAIENSIFDRSDENSALTYVDYRGFLLAEGGKASDVTTQLLGEISANTTLAANKTYQALGSIVVPAGITLTVNGKIQSYDNWYISGNLLLKNTASIENLSGDAWYIDGLLDIREGVRWSSINGGGININNAGRLNVVGTTAKPVIFTTSSTTPTQSSWSGLIANGTAQLNINNAVIEYATFGLQYSGNPTGTITNSKFLNNNSGVFSSNSTTENLVFTFNRFESNYYGVNFYGNGGKPTFNQNSFLNNTGLNVYAYNYAVVAPYPLLNFRNNWWGTTDINAIENSIFDQSDDINTHTYIDYRGFLTSEGGVASNAATQLIGEISANTTLAANTTYQTLGVISVPAGITLTVNGKLQSYSRWDIKGSLILNGSASVENLGGDSWVVSGAGSQMTMAAGSLWQSVTPGSLLIAEGAVLSVNGTAQKPVIFSSAQPIPNRGDWPGIIIRNASATINFAVIEWTSNGLQADNSALSFTNSRVQNFNSIGVSFINNATGTLNNNLIDNFDRSGSGVLIQDSSPTITNNLIQNNYIGLDIRGASNPLINNNTIAYNNYGFYLTGGAADATNPHPIVRDNDIVGNLYAAVYLYNYGATTAGVDFTRNWWGSATPDFAALIQVGSGSANIINKNNSRTAPVKGEAVSSLSLDREYFSPNADGINETAKLTATKTSTAAWVIEVRNSSFALVKEFSGTGKNLAAIWNGKNTAGVGVADGTYQFIIKVAPQTVPLATRRVIVDNTRPVSNIDNAFNNRVLNNEISLPVTGTASDLYLTNYLLEVTPAGGTSQVLTSTTAAVVNGVLGNWVVNSVDGSIQPQNGAYTLKLTSTDRAGNKVVDTANVTLNALAFTSVSHTPASINPSLNESVTINFSINKPATVNLTIAPELGGATVKTAQQTFAAAGNYSFSWNGKDAAGKFVADEAYTYVLTGSSGALTAIYDVPRGAPAGYGGSFDYQFSTAKNDYWKVTDLNFYGPQRAQLEIYPSAQPSFIAFTQLFPAGPAQVVWDGRDLAGNIMTGSLSIALTPTVAIKTNSVFVKGTAPQLSGGGVTPTIEIKTNPSLVTLSYEQVFSMVYRVDQNAYVTIRLTPPAGSSQPAVTLQNRVLRTALQNGLPKDQPFSWRGYAASDTNNLLIGENGTFTVEITAESALTGATTVYRSSVTLYE